MSVDPGPIESQAQPEKKSKPAKSAPPPKPTVKLGQSVLYTPSMTQANVLRSLRGYRDPVFVAMVTHIEAETGKVHLKVFPSHDMQPFSRMDATEGEGPNTFRPL